MRGAESASEKAIAASKQTASTTTSSEGIKVINISPPDGASGIPLDSPVIASFSESVDKSTVNSNTFSIKDNNNHPLTGDISVGSDGKTVTFKPAASLDVGTAHHVTITGIKDLTGKVSIAPRTSSFTTK